MSFPKRQRNACVPKLVPMVAIRGQHFRVCEVRSWGVMPGVDKGEVKGTFLPIPLKLWNFMRLDY
jgi:hypothetical protein